MYIENKDTIVFQSEYEHYIKEKQGRKPNTVRTIPLNEVNKWELGPVAPGDLFSSGIHITQIKIQCRGQMQYFIRKLKDVTVIPHEGTALWIFSWRH